MGCVQKTDLLTKLTAFDGKTLHYFLFYSQYNLFVLNMAAM